jgi:hypothetical protein
MSLEPSGSKPISCFGFIDHFPHPDESMHLPIEADVLSGAPANMAS